MESSSRRIANSVGLTQREQESLLRRITLVKKEDGPGIEAPRVNGKEYAFMLLDLFQRKNLKVHYKPGYNLPIVTPYTDFQNGEVAHYQPPRLDDVFKAMECCAARPKNLEVSSLIQEGKGVKKLLVQIKRAAASSYTRLATFPTVDGCSLKISGDGFFLYDGAVYCHECLHGYSGDFDSLTDWTFDQLHHFPSPACKFWKKNTRTTMEQELQVKLMGRVDMNDEDTAYLQNVYQELQGFATEEVQEEKRKQLDAYRVELLKKGKGRATEEARRVLEDEKFERKITAIPLGKNTLYQSIGRGNHAKMLAQLKGKLHELTLSRPDLRGEPGENEEEAAAMY